MLIVALLLCMNLLVTNAQINVEEEVIGKQKAIEWIQSLQTPEGYFDDGWHQEDNWSYVMSKTFWAIKSLELLNSSPTNVNSCKEWILSLQREDSGFYNPETEMFQYPVETTYMAVCSLVTLGSENGFTQEIEDFLLIHHSGGGFLDNFTLWATFDVLMAFKAFDVQVANRDEVIDYILSFRDDDGGFSIGLHPDTFTSSLWGTYMAVLSLDALGVDVPDKQATIDYIYSKQTSEGSFIGVNPTSPLDDTFYSIAALSVMGVEIPNKDKCIDYLLSLRSSNGGFKLFPAQATLIGTYLAIEALNYLEALDALERIGYTDVTEIPLTSGSITIDGFLNEDAWADGIYCHDISVHEKEIEYELYLVHDGASLYIGVKIFGDDLEMTDLGDFLEIEIDDENNRHFGGNSGNDVKRVMTLPEVEFGYYLDCYIPLDEEIDSQQDGRGDFTFSGPETEGSIGDYVFEVEIPVNSGDTEDAMILGRPFGMTISFFEYVQDEHYGAGYWLFRGNDLTLNGSMDIHSLIVNSEHGIPYPSVGSYSSGESVTASVNSPITEGNTVWTCTGWVGTGSVQASGSGTSTTFIITENSSITWIWEPVPQKAATPIIDPPTGTYQAPLIVTITSEDGIQATIYYTEDGTNPTNTSTSSSVYIDPFIIDSSKTIKARAYVHGMEPSDVATSVITVGSPADKIPTPVINPPTGIYSGSQIVSIDCDLSSATIRYTIDGSQPSSTSKQYTRPFEITSTTTVRAIAFETGLTTSDEAYANITISASTPSKVATPTFSPAGGEYSTAQSVEISCSTPGATIRYTTNGAQPMSTSTEYSGSLTVSDTTTILAKAFLTGWIESETASATYEIEPSTVIYSTDWDYVKNSYSGSLVSSESVWSELGNCYGYSSTALLYYIHYSLGDDSYPYYPFQSPPASYTVDLILPEYSVKIENGEYLAEIDKLTNAFLAITFRQLYDPDRDAFELSVEEKVEFNKMLTSLQDRIPVMLFMKGNKGVHAVIAWELYKKSDSLWQIKLYDPSYPEKISEAEYDESTNSFHYENGYAADGTQIIYNKFITRDPPSLIDVSWRLDWEVLLESSWYWENWLEWPIEGYTIVISDKKLTIEAFPGSASFDIMGNSTSFVCDIPGVCGITEGDMEVYTIPNWIDFIVVDPTPDKSTVLIVRIEGESEQKYINGFLIDATSNSGFLNYTISPYESGVSVNSQNSNFNADLVFFSCTRDTLNIFEASDLPIDTMQIVNFTVTDWQLLNSTSQTPVLLQISSSNQPEEIVTYNLPNGQQGLPQGSSEDIWDLLSENIFVISASLTIVVVCLIVSFIYLRRRKSKK